MLKSIYFQNFSYWHKDNYYVKLAVFVPKTVVDKFSFSELKIEKVKLFSQSPNKIFVLEFLTLDIASQVA